MPSSFPATNLQLEFIFEEAGSAAQEKGTKPLLAPQEIQPEAKTKPLLAPQESQPEAKTKPLLAPQESQPEAKNLSICKVCRKSTTEVFRHLQLLLPDGINYCVCSSRVVDTDKFHCNFVMDICSVEELKTWKEKFMKKSFSTFSIISTKWVKGAYHVDILLTFLIMNSFVLLYIY